MTNKNQEASRKRSIILNHKKVHKGRAKLDTLSSNAHPMRSFSMYYSLSEPANDFLPGTSRKIFNAPPMNVKCFSAAIGLK